jgi:disulfide bond formation protein DsbB
MESEPYVSPVLAAGSIGVVFAVLFAMLAAEHPAAATVRRLVTVHGQKLMFAVAATAMAGSLYYSEYVHFTPCELCWFQRIAMYPLAILLGVALLTRSRLDARYVVTLAGAGLAVSIYHYQLELFPDQAALCTGEAVSCTVRFVEEFGFVSIPFMAGCAFLSVLLLQAAAWRVRYLEERGLV